MFTTFYSHTYALLLQILIHYDRTYFSIAMTAKRYDRAEYYHQMVESLCGDFQPKLSMCFHSSTAA